MGGLHRNPDQDLRLALVVLGLVVLFYLVRKVSRERVKRAKFAVAPWGVGGGVATSGYPRRVAEGVPAPWRPPKMPPFAGALAPDPALSRLSREPLGDWHGYGDPWNALKALEAEVRPGAATWFRAGRGWADAPGSYEGSSASALSAFVMGT